jgi:quercetin dioxygenase-like cupin family protein
MARKCGCWQPQRAAPWRILNWAKAWSQKPWRTAPLMVWFFSGGEGKMWRKNDTAVETIDVHPGVSISIPAGTHFQFRCDSEDPLEAIATTMPPWPGDDEAYEVQGIWED